MSPNAKTFSIQPPLFSLDSKSIDLVLNWLLQAWVQIQHVENVKTFSLEPRETFHAAGFQNKTMHPASMRLTSCRAPGSMENGKIESESKSFTRRQQVLEEKQRNTTCWKPYTNHINHIDHIIRTTHIQSQVLHMLYVLNTPKIQKIRPCRNVNDPAYDCTPTTKN